MAQFTFLSKSGNQDCKALRIWLKKNNIDYTELKVKAKNVETILLSDPEYTQNFCDIDSCLIHLPAIKCNSTGEYFFKGLNDIWGIYELQKIVRDHVTNQH